MSNEENQISNLIEGGLAYEQEILLQITELQERASAASRACIHYMSPETGNTAKYLEALREHTKATSEINRLKNLLKDKV